MGVTIKDIAKVVGVASQNVSGVLSGNPRCRVSQATREKILNTARELGYCRNISAKILRGDNTHTVAILLSNKITHLLDEHLLRIIMRLLSRFNNERYACFFAETWNPVHDNLTTAKELVSRGVRSFVIIGNISDSQAIETLLKNNDCSFIQYIGNSSRRANISMNFAVKELWNTLSPSRKKHFKLISNPHLESNIRLEAFRSLDCDLSSVVFPSKLVLPTSENTEQLYLESGYCDTAELMRKSPETKVIMYHSDYYLKGGIQYFYEHGYRIGQDICLIGVNYSDLVRFSPFPLWSMCHPEEEIIDFLCVEAHRKEAVNRTFEMQLKKNLAAERQNGITL